VTGRAVTVVDSKRTAASAAAVREPDVRDPSGNPRSPSFRRARTPSSVLRVEGLAGLSEEQARALFQQGGPNEIPAQQKRGLAKIVLEVVREPMFLMLVAAGVVYLLMGEPTDALLPCFGRSGRDAKIHAEAIAVLHQHVA